MQNFMDDCVARLMHRIDRDMTGTVRLPIDKLMLVADEGFANPTSAQFRPDRDHERFTPLHGV